MRSIARRWPVLGADVLRVAPRPSNPITVTAAALQRVLRGRAAWWCLPVCLGIVLILPLFLVDIPPLTDYPNHLAREFVLAYGAHDPVISRMYATHWGIIPNLAIDVAMPALAQIVPLYLAGKIILAVTLLLPVAGAAAYHRAVFGYRSLWPLASGLVAYNGLFLLGFLNFQISLGLAMLGAAAWVRWRDRRPLLLAVLGAVWSSVIFFAHVFGLLFLAAIIGGWEFQRLLNLRRDGKAIWPQLVGSAARVTAVFALPCGLCLLAPIAGRGGGMVWRPLLDRLLWLLLPFFSYTIVSGVLAGAAILALLYVLARHRMFGLAPGAVFTMMPLLAAYLVSPFVANGTGFVGERLPIMLGFMLFAAGRPMRLSSAARLATVGLLTAAFALKMTTICEVWSDHNSDLAEMRRVIAPVPAGSRVVAVSVYAADNPAYWQSMQPGRVIPALFPTYIHLPALLLMEHRAFWPLLFTARGKQPLILRPPYDQLDGHQGEPPDYHVLQHPISTKEAAVAPYLRHWQTDFDYVLLLNAGGARDLPNYVPARLRLVTQGDVAALFRIVPGVPSATTATR